MKSLLVAGITTVLLKGIRLPVLSAKQMWANDTQRI